jgi:hypothetical protein
MTDDLTASEDRAVRLALTVARLTADLAAAAGRADAAERYGAHWKALAGDHAQVIANVRALADEHEAHPTPYESERLTERLRALLPAAPTGEGS